LACFAWPVTPRGRDLGRGQGSGREASGLKEVMAELTLENRLLKKA
jgi:hypothetical protein